MKSPRTSNQKGQPNKVSATCSINVMENPRKSKPC